MKRLWASIKNDCIVQFRNGFYYAGLFIFVFVAALLMCFFEQDQMAFVLPVFYVGGMQGTTMFFFAALLLLEKSEQTLDGLLVSPLRNSEYIWSKIITLTALAVVEALAVTFFAYGFELNLALLLFGIIGLSVIYCLVGLALVAPYSSITDFLMPSIPYAIGLEIIALPYFGIFDYAAMYLIPTMPTIVLMKSAFVPIGWAMFAYAALGTIFWIAALHWLAVRRFEKYIVRKEVRTPLLRSVFPQAARP